MQGITSILIFAFVPLAIKYTKATPITICLFRLILTVGVLAIFWQKKISFKKFFTLPGLKLWSIGFIFFIHWITYAYGVKVGGPSIGVIGLSTYGIQLIVAGYFFFDHPITKKDLLCLTFSFIGIMMIIPSWSLQNESTWGLVLSLLSATSFALIPIMHKKTQEFSEETRVFAQFFGALICFLFFFGNSHWDLKSTDWVSLIFLGLFGTLIAHSFWVRISTKVSPNITGLAYYTIAPITIFSSAILLGEKLTILQISGAVLVILSAVANIVKM